MSHCGTWLYSPPCLNNGQFGSRVRLCDALRVTKLFYAVCSLQREGRLHYCPVGTSFSPAVVNWYRDVARMTNYCLTITVCSCGRKDLVLAYIKIYLFIPCYVSSNSYYLEICCSVTVNAHDFWRTQGNDNKTTRSKRGSTWYWSEAAGPTLVIPHLCLSAATLCSCVPCPLPRATTKALGISEAFVFIPWTYLPSCRSVTAKLTFNCRRMPTFVPV